MQAAGHLICASLAGGKKKTAPKGGLCSFRGRMFSGRAKTAHGTQCPADGTKTQQEHRPGGRFRDGGIDVVANRDAVPEFTGRVGPGDRAEGSMELDGA